MSNVISLSKAREQRAERTPTNSEKPGCVVLVTSTGKIAAFVGKPDIVTGDAVFVDEHEAYFGPLREIELLAARLQRSPSALTMAVGGFHLEAVAYSR